VAALNLSEQKSYRGTGNANEFLCGEGQ